jgi:hypothetical protein
MMTSELIAIWAKAKTHAMQIASMRSGFTFSASRGASPTGLESR